MTPIDTVRIAAAATRAARFPTAIVQSPIRPFRPNMITPSLRLADAGAQLLGARQFVQTINYHECVTLSV
jgi:hypothetical protein